MKSVTILQVRPWASATTAPWSLGVYTIFADILVETVRYASDGTYLRETEVSSGTAPSTSPDDIVTLTNGSIAALYTLGAGSSTPYVRVFGVDGSLLTDLALVPGVDTDGSGNFSAYDIDATPSGGFVVTVGFDSTYARETATIVPGLFGGENVRRQSDVRVVEYNSDGILAALPISPTMMPTFRRLGQVARPAPAAPC